MTAPLVIPTRRTRPLGEPDPRVQGSTGLHRHDCAACGREWLHAERLCVEPYEWRCRGCALQAARGPASWPRVAR